jgi:hypothetical protein
MRVSQELEQWADGHQTSKEIASAIEDMAGCDETKMQRIWENPTAEEMAEVSRRAWEMADEDETELYWGCEKIKR